MTHLNCLWNSDNFELNSMSLSLRFLAVCFKWEVTGAVSANAGFANDCKRYWIVSFSLESSLGYSLNPFTASPIPIHVTILTIPSSFWWTGKWLNGHMAGSHSLLHYVGPLEAFQLHFNSTICEGDLVVSLIKGLNQRISWWAMSWLDSDPDLYILHPMHLGNFLLSFCGLQA